MYKTQNILSETFSFPESEDEGTPPLESFQTESTQENLNINFAALASTSTNFSENSIDQSFALLADSDENNIS